ncbi:MAG: DUF2975 domain-containing protein [Clostridiales bacterium]|nr:DUF2975 domain-containing protein [Clostridiales bacterium]
MEVENNVSKKNRSQYRMVSVLSKIGAPIFKILYYLFIAGLVLCGIIALIIFLVNTSVEKIMLPPLMTLHGHDYYSIFIGNGIRIDTAYEAVKLADIKTVIYAELIMIAAFCCMMAPVSLFLSQLMKNIANGAPYNLKNARYTIYIGLSVMVGYTFVLFARRFYNYLLVKTFVADSDAIHLSLGLDFGGILIGLLIIFLGYVIGHASERHVVETAVPENHTDIVQK